MSTSNHLSASTPSIPKHVAIIMDGNGRWGKNKGLTRLAGHKAGTQNIIKVVQTFSELGVEYLTLFAFSTENWGRPQPEVKGLINILENVIVKETSNLDKANVRLNHLGNLNRLSPRLQEIIRKAVQKTNNNTGLTLSVAFDYGGRQEIVDAARRIIEDQISASQLDEQLFRTYLGSANIPDPDLLIRTGGEERFSNFLLWQSAYSEYYCSAAPWPDFGHQDIKDALEAYSKRRRSFGKLPNKTK
jgi:undecaprenyl diphosphate synthase|tara:strand:- start:4762 stop:5496 length:735 start_codon:yes stop_codon:yes gene_type:complete